MAPLAALKRYGTAFRWSAKSAWYENEAIIPMGGHLRLYVLPIVLCRSATSENSFARASECAGSLGLHFHRVNQDLQHPSHAFTEHDRHIVLGLGTPHASICVKCIKLEVFFLRGADKVLAKVPAKHVGQANVTAERVSPVFWGEEDDAGQLNGPVVADSVVVIIVTVSTGTGAVQ